MRRGCSLVAASKGGRRGRLKPIGGDVPALTTRAASRLAPGSGGGHRDTFRILSPAASQTMATFPSRLLLALVLPALLGAAEQKHRVDSPAALREALRRAVPGDRIQLKDGVHQLDATLSIRSGGTADRPLVIEAETLHGAELTGSHGIAIGESAEHVVIRGLRLTHAAGRFTVAAGARHIRITRNQFRCSGDGVMLSISGDDVEVDHNEFAEKTTTGAMLALAGAGQQVARRAWIHHNLFRDFVAPLGSNSEMLRVGLSVTGLSVGRALVEHNLFLRARGETRLISNRSSGNVYRHNTFAESPTAQVDLRHGNEVEFYGNFLRGTEGLRLFGDRHRVHGNYFESNYAGISLGNGTVESAGPGAPAAAMDRPDDCAIVFNTFVDNRTHLQLARAAGERLGARNITVAHNVFQGGTTVARIDGPYAGAVWQGNFLGPRVSPGQMPPEGYTRGNLQLQAAADGLQRPAPSSPLLDAGSRDFPFVQVDLDGQPRGDRPDAGADEVSTAPASARPLRPEDVGPGARTAAATGSTP